MYSYHRHPQQQQHYSFIGSSSVQQQAQQQQISATMTPVPMATPSLDFGLDGSMDQALLDMMDTNTSDLLTMDGFEGSFPVTPGYPLDNITLDNHNNWALHKEQDWMSTPYDPQQQPSSLFSESPLFLHSSQYQHHFQQQQLQQQQQQQPQPQPQHNHQRYYQNFQQQQQQQHHDHHDQNHRGQQQTQQQQQQQQLSHIHPLQTLSPLACDALLTNTNASSNNNSSFFLEEPTSIAPREMLPMDASLASSPSWSSSPASVASSIEDNKPTTPLDTTFYDELVEPRQLELIHRSPSPLPTTMFDDDQEEEEDDDQDNQSLLLVQQQQQEQYEVELEEEQEDDEDDNDSDPDWSFGKKPQQQPSRLHVHKSSKSSRATNKSNKKTRTKKLANHNSQKASSGLSTPELANNNDIRCTNCETQNTPLWRRDSAGLPLCNACGLFLKLHGVVRPLSLKTDVIKKRNRSGHSIHKSSRSRKSRREKK